MTQLSRRQLLRSGTAAVLGQGLTAGINRGISGGIGSRLGLGALGLGASGCATRSAAISGGPLTGSPTGPDDETWWSRVAAEYEVTPGIISVENGNWGVMAKPVLAAYQEHTARVNRDNSYFARREYRAIYRDIVADTAERLGAQPAEVAFTRGATEALQNLILGYGELEPGAAVMLSDLDYGSMQDALRWKAASRGCRVHELAIPDPIGHDDLVDFYAAAFARHPETRLLLLTHLSHRTGLVMPVRAIIEQARAHNIDVIVDAAHSWGQLDFTVDDLGADFVGFNLHKWMGAPIGVGAMYVRAARLGSIEPNLSATPGEADKIYGRVHSGTSNFAAYLTVPAAFAFQDRLGATQKAARLKYLRDVWVSRCRDLSGVEILTPDDHRLHAGITSFRLTGRTSVEQNQALAAYLLDEHQIFTVHRDGVAAGACVRVTPGYYNSAAELERVAAAIATAANTL